MQVAPPAGGAIGRKRLWFIGFGEGARIDGYGQLSVILENNGTHKLRHRKFALVLAFGTGRYCAASLRPFRVRRLNRRHANVPPLSCSFDIRRSCLAPLFVHFEHPDFRAVRYFLNESGYQFALALSGQSPFFVVMPGL
jgi:hypothetical protein